MAELSTLPELTHATPSYERGSFEDDKDSLDKEKASDTAVQVTDADTPPIYDIKSGDPLPDVSDTLPVETHQLTFRALFVGCMLGCVVQASNLYLGLKTGFTFGPQLFGAIFGYAILKPLSIALPVWLGGGYFGEKENVTCQTAATAAGGLGILFVSGIPAMYQLGLLSASPTQDLGRLIAFTACCAFYGMMFAIPLRKWYILRQKLVFPTPTATALTIRALHAGPGGAAAAKSKARCLLYSFIFAIILKVLSQYAPGIIWDWHPFWWLATWGATQAIRADNWGFFWENTPAFLGAGLLTGVNASASFYGGTVLAWGIIGPALMASGRTVARDFSADYENYPVYNYTKMKFANPQGLVSPRYFLLWTGIFVMLFASFAEIGCNGASIVSGAKDVYRSAANSINRRRGLPEKYIIPPSILDPSPAEDQVPLWAWAGGLTVVSITTVIVMAKLFDIEVGISILAILCGFLFSFIGVQCAGDTDINPISTCAKATQLVVGGATHGKYLNTIVVDPTAGSLNIGAMRINLLAALISGGAAAQTTDMTGDLKTGHLMRAKPVNQFIAQGAGAFCSIFLSCGLFVLFTKAYPCIIDTSYDTCPFAVPSAASWAAVARATSSTNGLPFPAAAGVLALCLTILSVAIVFAKKFLVPEAYKQYVPNVVAAGLGFILPPGQTQYSLVMLVAALGGYYWKKRNITHYDMFAFALAAGLIAGEGLGGVVSAVFVILKIDGSIYGTAIGCPGLVYCG